MYGLATFEVCMIQGATHTCVVVRKTFLPAMTHLVYAGAHREYLITWLWYAVNVLC